MDKELGEMKSYLKFKHKKMPAQIVLAFFINLTYEKMSLLTRHQLQYKGKGTHTLI
ncbi:hypothetical protein GCM10028809_23450 [Spirosoma gilvum]